MLGRIDLSNGTDGSWPRLGLKLAGCFVVQEQPAYDKKGYMGYVKVSTSKGYMGYVKWVRQRGTWVTSKGYMGYVKVSIGSSSLWGVAHPGRRFPFAPN